MVPANSLSQTFEQYRAVINVIRNTFAFPSTTCENVKSVRLDALHNLQSSVKEEEKKSFQLSTSIYVTEMRFTLFFASSSVV